MSKTVPVIVGVLLVVVLVLFNTTYSVSFHEVAIKTRFGRAEGVERNPGLHFKAPFFIDRVSKFDKRLQLVDSPLETVQTQDGQQVLVQSFLLWRIAEDDEGVKLFVKSFGSVDDASKALEAQLLSAVRVVGSFRFDELIGVGNRLAEAEASIMAELQKGLPGGVMASSVGIAQIVLPPKTTTAVLRRMQATQERLAETERYRGNAEADAIRSEAATKADKIRAFAEARAKQIEAEGNQAAKRYFEQMRQSEDLAIFLSWLDTLKRSLTGYTTFVVDTTRPPFHLMDLGTPTGPGGIPVPSSGYAYPKGGPEDGKAPAAGSGPAANPPAGKGS
ncbi:MAG: hypothetical protein KDA22_15730 [Phycisphaerales bacterium]|nr:hypothetical protein [Phycisphaerales bacterium]